MTDDQLAALQAYVRATVCVMTEKGDHSSNVRLYVDARRQLQQAFGKELPAYVDLFAAPSPFPDIL